MSDSFISGMCSKFVLILHLMLNIYLFYFISVCVWEGGVISVTSVLMLVEHEAKVAFNSFYWYHHYYYCYFGLIFTVSENLFTHHEKSRINKCVTWS